jgi:hypothetical protein
VRAGQVVAEGVVIELDVDASRAQEITLGILSPAGHHIAEVPLTQREAMKLRDTLAEAVDVLYSPEAPRGSKVGRR